MEGSGSEGLEEVGRGTGSGGATWVIRDIVIDRQRVKRDCRVLQRRVAKKLGSDMKVERYRSKYL